MAIGKSLQYSTFSSISCYNGFKILSSSTPGTGICCRKEVYRASQRFPIPVCIHLFCLFSTFIKEYNVWQLRQLKDRDISQVGPSKRGGSSPPLNALPGDNPFSWACNMCWPCSGPQSWPLF